jgi:hypothetical protein
MLNPCPTKRKMSIELMSSKSERFAIVENDLDKAERYLIQQWTPCFNEALNTQPTPCPDRYARPNAKPSCSRSLNKLIHEAARAVKADEKLFWLEAVG